MFIINIQICRIWKYLTLKTTPKINNRNTTSFPGLGTRLNRNIGIDLPCMQYPVLVKQWGKLRNYL